MRPRSTIVLGCLLACLMGLSSGARAAAADLDLTPLGGLPVTRLLTAAGSSGLMEFEFFTAPLELQPLAGATPGKVNLRLSGPAGVSVVVQRSTDLTTWQNSQEVTLTAPPVTITVPAASAGEFFRLKGR